MTNISDNRSAHEKIVTAIRGEESKSAADAYRADTRPVATGNSAPMSYIESYQEPGAGRGWRFRPPTWLLGALIVLVSGGLVATDFGRRIPQAGRQREAVNRLIESGNTVYYTYQFDRQGMLRPSLPVVPGADYVFDVRRVLVGMQVGNHGGGVATQVQSEASIISLRALRGLREVVFYRDVRPADLKVLAELRSLQVIKLGGHAIPPQHLQWLRHKLPWCRIMIS